MGPQAPINAASRGALVTRQRFAFAGALVAAGLLPFAVRIVFFPDPAFFETSQVSLVANIAAVVIATWIRLSVGTFPGTRSGTLIAPAIATAHGIVLVLLLMTRLPYDQLGILFGFIAHLVWAVELHLAVHRRVRRRFAVVPWGAVDHLQQIDGVDWKMMQWPSLHEAIACDAVVADFSADLPPAWESFLADAALAGRMVYHVKHCPNRSPGGSRSRTCPRTASAACCRRAAISI